MRVHCIGSARDPCSGAVSARLCCARMHPDSIEKLTECPTTPPLTSLAQVECYTALQPAIGENSLARRCNMPTAGLPLERPIKLTELLETGLRHKAGRAGTGLLGEQMDVARPGPGIAPARGTLLRSGAQAGRPRRIAPAQSRGTDCSLPRLHQSRARRHSAQLSLPGAGNRSRTGSQRRRGDRRPRRARRGPGEKQAGRSIAARPNIVRR